MARLSTTDYAAFLRAVADHLDKHGLIPPWLRPGFSGSEIQVPVSDGPAAFIAWCHSLGVTHLQVSLFGDSAHLHVRDVPMGAVSVDDLWTGIHGLQENIEPAADDEGPLLTLTVAELEHYAEHGALPVRSVADHA